MARKRRRRLKAGFVLFVLLLASTTAGMLVSSATAVTKVRVVGAKPWDHERIEKALQPLKGVPVVKVVPERIETELLQLSAMRSAELSRNLFGRAVLKLEYREAVARLESPAGVGFDRTGELFSAPDLDPELPVIVPPAAGWENELTVASSWPKRRIAELAEEVSGIFPGEGFTVTLDTPSGVCLNMRSGTRIEFGVPDDFPQKIDKLREIAGERSDLLTTLELLNLRVPENPTQIVRRPKGQSR